MPEPIFPGLTNAQIASLISRLSPLNWFGGNQPQLNQFNPTQGGQFPYTNTTPQTTAQTMTTPPPRPIPQLNQFNPRPATFSNIPAPNVVPPVNPPNVINSPTGWLQLPAGRGPAPTPNFDVFGNPATAKPVGSMGSFRPGTVLNSLKSGPAGVVGLGILAANILGPKLAEKFYGGKDEYAKVKEARDKQTFPVNLTKIRAGGKTRDTEIARVNYARKAYGFGTVVADDELKPKDQNNQPHQIMPVEYEETAQTLYQKPFKDLTETEKAKVFEQTELATSILAEASNPSTPSASNQQIYEIIEGAVVPIYFDNNGVKQYDWSNKFFPPTTSDTGLTEYQRQSLELQRAENSARNNPQLPSWLLNQRSPYDDPNTQEVEGYRDASGNWQPPAGYVSPQDRAQMELTQRMFEQSQYEFQVKQEQERQNYLSNLRANPASWIEYSLASGQQPVVQPWMQGLLGGGVNAPTGSVIPGFTPTAPTAPSAGNQPIAGQGVQPLPGQTQENTNVIAAINRKIASGQRLTEQELGIARMSLPGSLEFYFQRYPEQGSTPAPVSALPPTTQNPEPEPPKPLEPPPIIGPGPNPNPVDIWGDDPNTWLMANGGVAWGPTKAILGEREPEAVIPLRQLQEYQVQPQTTNASDTTPPDPLKLLNPSLQYLRRMNPSQIGQYQSYQKAQKGLSPDDLGWLWNLTAPPSGQNAGLRWLR